MYLDYNGLVSLSAAERHLLDHGGSQTVSIPSQVPFRNISNGQSILLHSILKYNQLCMKRMASDTIQIAHLSLHHRVYHALLLIKLQSDMLRAQRRKPPSIATHDKLSEKDNFIHNPTCILSQVHEDIAGPTESALLFQSINLGGQLLDLMHK